jgi:hypothetical protein
MKLYHFTSEHLLPDILKQGITLGVLPIFNEQLKQYEFLTPCQWLTKDSDFNNQSWATSHILGYDRTAFRITVVIPKHHRSKLWSAYDYLPKLPGENKRLIKDWTGSKDWYLFFGKIPRGWIREVKSKAV